MKLYKIWQEVNNDYDTYDSAIVCAKDEECARLIRPDIYSWKEINGLYNSHYAGSWAKRLEDVKVEYIGEAVRGLEEGVILSSFNAG